MEEKRFLASLADAFEIGPEHSRVAFAGFSSDATTVFNFTDPQTNDAVREVIEDRRQDAGATNLAAWVPLGPSRLVERSY